MESSLKIEELTEEDHTNSSNDGVNALVFQSEKGNLVTTSLLVAEKFGKEHKNVIQAIEALFVSAENSAQTDNQSVSNMFYLSHREVSLNNGTDAKRRVPIYLMNRDGFSLLVMGFTGKKAFPEKNLAHILNAQKK